MIIICQECNTRYSVPETAFGEKGRTFRCASCGHSWFQEPPEQAFEALLAATEPEIETTPEPARKPVLEKEIEKPAQKIVKTYPLRATGGFKAGFILLCLLIALLYPLQHRKILMEHYGFLHGIFNPLGVYNVEGLAITDIKITKVPQEEKIMRVSVDCSVVNHANETRFLPMVKASILDEQGKKIAISENMVEQGRKIKMEEGLPCKTFVFDMRNDEAKTIRLDLGDKIDLLLEK